MQRQLSEANLNNAEIGFVLSGDTFVDNNLQVSNFQLNGAPTGTSIQSVSYSNSQGAQIVLSFDGTDFDINHSISIAVLAAELQGDESITSNNLTVNAINEDAPMLQISSLTDLNENNLDSSVIQLELTNETFENNNLESGNFELLNAPTGCSSQGDALSPHTAPAASTESPQRA